MGHDQVEILTEKLGTLGNKTEDISFLFAGNGDGRNLFSAITTMLFRDTQKHNPPFEKAHFTILDLKPAALARVLIFFNMMADAVIGYSAKVPGVMDYFLAMAYLFSCQIIPPFVNAQLQVQIKELIESLECGSEILGFVYIRDDDRESIIRVLRQWQKSWDGMSEIASVRELTKRNLK